MFSDNDMDDGPAGSWEGGGASLAPPSDWSAGTIPGTTGSADPDAPGVAGSAGVILGTGTGQYGLVPIEAGGGGMGGSVVTVWDWLNKPFTTPLNTTQIAMLVGIVLVSVIAWNLILFHIKLAAETI
jgi:hypothetical protein